ncbi:uncharacterized protein LOC124152922 [Haliotis rufescens]|uniref:uncharacterized protein LOC124152922 n=1 Tax=Haliotis rufescens TaxID=6454 RepID=UPI00201F164D|nr:uncharacterized protein LOC124152922 [Haliotis rufescens]
MRALLTCFCLLVLLVCISADLLATLKMIHKSPAFHQLPPSEQVLLVELMAEAEADQLHAYVNHIGMDRLIAMMAHLPEHEASLLLKYLNAELQQESHHGN